MSGALSLLPAYRITVFAPPAALDALIDGICAVDDLRIDADGAAGHYDRVLWISAPGREQFRPLTDAAPTHGSTGVVSHTDSVRIEFCIPRDAARLQRLIDTGIRPHHPWRLPAVFVDDTLLPLPGATA